MYVHEVGCGVAPDVFPPEGIAVEPTGVAALIGPLPPPKGSGVLTTVGAGVEPRSGRGVPAFQTMSSCSGSELILYLDKMVCEEQNKPYAYVVSDNGQCYAVFTALQNPHRSCD